MACARSFVCSRVRTRSGNIGLFSCSSNHERVNNAAIYLITNYKQYIFLYYLNFRSFLPFLYIGLEYTLSNNFKLAERFYQQALNIECDDPFVLHELGVIWFKSLKYVWINFSWGYLGKSFFVKVFSDLKSYQNAEISMRRAYNKLKSSSQRNIFKEWEPLLNNLGHVCRKLK